MACGLGAVVWLAGDSALLAQTGEPVVLVSGLSSPTALSSDGNSVTAATELYFAETVGSRTMLRRVSANGGEASSLLVTDASLQSGEYRGIRSFVPGLFGYFWGDIGSFDSAFLFARTSSGDATKLTTFSGGALIGNASVNLIYFDQYNRLLSHAMYTNTEAVVATGYYPRASVSSYTEMFFQNDSDLRIYRVDYDSTTKASSVKPFTDPRESLGNLFIGAGSLYFATASRVLRMPTAGGLITEVVRGFSGVALAADYRFVYYVDGTSLKYVAVTGGPSGVLATVPEGGITGMIVTDQFTNPVIFWAQADGKIVKLAAPKTAPVAPPPPTPATGPSRISNLSILASITATDPSFTVGTVIGGAATVGNKQLLVRAVGPSLSLLRVEGALSDPKLDLFSGQTVVGSNDNWGGTAALTAAFAQVGAFSFASAASKDAAILNGALPVGGYTVQVSGVGGAAGLVIAELYDATLNAEVTAATPRLINVSVLKNIDAGSNLTAGFVIAGSTTRQVLIRAVGPTLGAAPFNVGGTMADPKVDLYSGSAVLVSNNDWSTPVGSGSATVAQVSAAAAQVGAFALGAGSRDAALLVTLAPGVYTAQVSGANGSGGLALVEVYEVR